jgi:hypothetical protein
VKGVRLQSQTRVPIRTFRLGTDRKSLPVKVKLHTGVFAEKVDSPTSEPPPEPPKREELLARAKELEISGVSSMRNDQIQTAILEAENQKGDDA